MTAEADALVREQQLDQAWEVFLAAYEEAWRRERSRYMDAEDRERAHYDAMHEAVEAVVLHNGNAS